MYIATAMWLLMVLGFLNSKNRRLHVPLVLTAMLGDLVLVLYLEFTREAVETALQFKMKMLQQIHIGVSTIALILYFPLTYLGFQMLKGNYQFRTLHRKLALTTLTFRSLGVLFMFSMWKG